MTDTARPFPIHAPLLVNKLTRDDLYLALRKGYKDLEAVPSYVVLLALIYPVVGLILFRGIFHYELLPLLFPFVLGFALVGPVAAVAFYEISRLRERGTEVTWSNVVHSLSSRSVVAFVLLGTVLFALFAAWILVAYAIYLATFGNAEIISVSAFLHDIFTTKAGLTLLVVGNVVGLIFAIIALSISVVSFPLMIDRDVDAGTAALTSIRVVYRNPLIMLKWGAIVWALLLLGSLPFLTGLAVVMPLLGHATWHLYRRSVV